jgi:hypothetical protein
MLRRLASMVLLAVLLIAPTLAFATNAELVTRANSCCNEMAGGCDSTQSPESCCKVSLVRVETKLVVPADISFTSTASLLTLTVFAVPELRTVSILTLQHDAESPPLRSPRLEILRI